MTTSAPPSPSTSSSYTHVADLPVHLTRFIGRDHELTELSRLIGATRLLTLTGAGGSGKTRLAREVAAAHAGRYARIGWVDLAPITDPVSIAREVATALHIPDRGGRPAEALVETTVLRAKQGIVILLINWSGRPLKGLAVKLALPDVPTGEATLASGLPVHRDGDRYVLDLDIADALVLRGR